MDRLELEIVTPGGKALSETVDEVTAPGVQGEFGILPGHIPVLASLRAGIVSYRKGNETMRCAIGQGFAEGGATKLLILTDDYREREKIDPVQVKQELQKVQDEIQKADTTPAERKTLIVRESWLAAQLDLYGGEATPAIMRPSDDWDKEDDNDVVATDDSSN